MDAPGVDAALQEAVRLKGPPVRQSARGVRLTLRDLGGWRLFWDGEDGGRAAAAAVAEDAGEPGDGGGQDAVIVTDAEALRLLASGALSPLKALTTGRVSLKSGEREFLAPWLPTIRHAGALLAERQAAGAAGAASLLPEGASLSARVGDGRVGDGRRCVYAVHCELQCGGPAHAWTVDRRYSHFRALWKALGGSSAAGPAFPRKQLLNSTTSAQQRRASLESWLQSVLAGSPRSVPLLAFLDAPAQAAKAAALAAPGALADAAATEEALRARVPFAAAGLDGRRRLVAKLRSLEEQLQRVAAGPSALVRLGASLLPALPLCLPGLLVAAALSAGSCTAARAAIAALLPLPLRMSLPSGGAALLLLPGPASGHLRALLDAALGDLPQLLLLALCAFLAALCLSHRGLMRTLRVYSVAFAAIGAYVLTRLAARALRLPRTRAAHLYARLDGAVAPFVAAQFVALRSIWVKIGQYVSGRGDMVNAAWQGAFRVMQADMPGDAAGDLEATLCGAFGVASLDEVFSAFDYAPIASASIAQVHRAVLRSTGEVVAVKVQHRGIAQVFREDMRRSVVIARLMAWLNSDFETLVTLLRAWERDIEGELDFRRECRNLREVRRILVDEHGANVAVPRVHDALVAREAFAMEFVDGGIFKSDDLMLLELHRVDKRALVSLIVNVWSCMVFQHGLFNADPHPGNCMVRLGEDAVPVLLDWGWTVRLAPDALRSYQDLVIALEELDTAAASAALRALGYENSQDARAPERSVQFFGYLFRDTGDREATRRSHEAFFERRKEQRRRDEADGVRESGGRKMKKVPEQFMTVVRVVGLLRGISTALEVQLPLIEIMARHARIGRERLRAAAAARA